MAPPKPKLHYNKADLHQDYQTTFGLLMKALLVGVGGAVLYFFATIIYLGGWSHTPGSDYVRTFSSRIQYEYGGTKLPEYEDPTILDRADDKASH